MDSVASFSKPVHGTLPQNLIEKIVRLRIYESRYWKEHCFGLTAELLVDKAVSLQYFGGVCSENNKPTPFLCLLLKMLQIQPDLSIVLEFVRNEEYKYVRCLGVLYLRLVGTPLQIYKELEPFYSDYRKLRFQTKTGWKLTYMDEWIDELLHEDIVLNIVLPRLSKRLLLEEAGQLSERVSALQMELDSSENEAGTEDDEDSSSSLSSDSVSSDSASDLDVEAKTGDTPAEIESHEREKSLEVMEEDKNETTKRKHSKMKKEKKKQKKKKKKKKKKHKKQKIVVRGLKATPAAPKSEEEEGRAKVGENSVEYWNMQREKLGLKRLKE
eukprot:CAMPEP_0204827606 /NCGR_PEP_ID=MMETSP1346-20131115/5040_1 /ASSEMBLY_ACC=CAM_ASM_000771 /TAXON_ID=215587 /ORGANISM="Aplanochytrium stocchinoi, Strain GSBS06" /LENGTH=326 /DNA_ID=CAMNT_0051956101 /DNA_START=78 /DNA_END=1058 /DNA_ORIENTATION=+